MGWVWYGLGLIWVGFDMGWVWYWFGMVLYGMIWNGFVFSIMSNASLCFILDEGLETFLEIRDLEIYILLIYMVIRLQTTAPIGFWPCLQYHRESQII